MNILVATVYHYLHSLKDDFRVRLIPHKRKLLNSGAVQDCHGQCEAQLITTTSRNGEVKRFSYTYVGRGVAWQPPYTYALVTRELSLDVADFMMAVFVCLEWSTVSRDMFVRRQNEALKQRLTSEEKDDAISARLEAINKKVAALHKSHVCIEYLTETFFPQEDVEM